jgi:hypothetical protein
VKNLTMNMPMIATAKPSSTPALEMTRIASMTFGMFASPASVRRSAGSGPAST